MAATLSLSFLLFSALQGSENRIAVMFGVLLGVAAAYALVRYPEIALGLFLLVGQVKGEKAITSLVPFDLTIGVASFVALGMLVRWIRREPHPSLPRVYWLFIPILSMMLLSLSYTPDLQAGLYKTGRFFILTGLAIVAPFLTLNSPVRLLRFMATCVAASVIQSLASLSMLGGKERFGVIGEPQQTIDLGIAAAGAVIIIFYVALPRRVYRRRLVFYPVIILLLIALVGSGARSATIGLVLALALGLCFYRKLLVDCVLLAALGALTLSLVRVPTASYDYLATLVRQDPVSVLGSRGNLMALAARLMAENPWLGVGIGGYPASSPNPPLYNWPHNVFLEIGAEMGIPSALAFLGLVAAAFWETIGQLTKASFSHKAFSRVVLALLILGLVEILSTGDINNDRNMWLYMGLPFVVREFAVTGCQKPDAEPGSSYV